MGKRLTGALIAGTLGCAVALSACGSSSHSAQTIRGDAILRAADVTAGVPGYRLAATMTMITPLGPQMVRMSGVYDRAGRTGEMTASETISGHHLTFTELFSGLTLYLRVSGVPGLSAISAGKPWLKFDMSRMLGAMGLGSLPTGTDPSQFLDYLRAVSSSTMRVGADTVRGVSTTHYHAMIDLSRYPALVPKSQRAAAARSVSTLETALGSHTMPVDAWVDQKNLVRRIDVGLRECVAKQKLRMNMTMDLFDYGPQQTARLPASDAVDDITPLVAASVSKLKLGCSSS